MKNFWPYRPRAKGFSIQKLASKYRLKISSYSFSSNEDSNQILDDKELILMKEESKKKYIAYQLIKKIHWANRDFSEYKDAV